MGTASYYVLAAGIALRLCLLPYRELLGRSLQVSTPFVEAASLAEGRYWLSLGRSPYALPDFHHSPLVLLLSQALHAAHPLAQSLLLVGVDGAAGVLLGRITALYQRRGAGEGGVLVTGWAGLPTAAMAVYLLNPLAAISCAAGTTAGVANAAVLLCLCSALRGRTGRAAAALAVATHLSPYHALVLPLACQIARGTPPPPASLGAGLRQGRGKGLGRSGWGHQLRGWGAFGATLLALGGCCEYAFPGRAWLRATWGDMVGIASLTPNVGLAPLFFSLLFAQFRPYFRYVWTAHLAAHAIPLSLRWADQPLFGASVLIAITGAVKPYPSVADAALTYALLAVHDRAASRLRFAWPIALAAVYNHATMEHALHCWLVSGRASSNYYYYQTVLYSVLQTGLITSTLWEGATLRAAAAGALDVG